MLGTVIAWLFSHSQPYLCPCNSFRQNKFLIESLWVDWCPNPSTGVLLGLISFHIFIAMNLSYSHTHNLKGHPHTKSPQFSRDSHICPAPSSSCKFPFILLALSPVSLHSLSWHLPPTTAPDYPSYTLSLPVFSLSLPPMTIFFPFLSEIQAFFLGSPFLFSFVVFGGISLVSSCTFWLIATNQWVHTVYVLLNLSYLTQMIVFSSICLWNSLNISTWITGWWSKSLLLMSVDRNV